jgi:flavin reductase (DIM6/NTAB) family NADH-FMN oxidoreductase RutF
MTDAAGGAVADFDRFVDGLDYPMFIVTTAHGTRRAGCLVGFVTQTSIHPPRLLVCLSVNNHTHHVAQDASVIAVHLVRPDRRDLAALFGSTTGDEIDKFDRCQWEAGPAGVPLLGDSVRWMTGRILDRIPLGDHVGYLLELIATGGDGNGPFLTFQDVRDLPAGHRA